MISPRVSSLSAGGRTVTGAAVGAVLGMSGGYGATKFLVYSGIICWGPLCPVGSSLGILAPRLSYYSVPLHGLAVILGSQGIPIPILGDAQ
jgi:hypothetical protein